MAESNTEPGSVITPGEPPAPTPEAPEQPRPEREVSAEPETSGVPTGLTEDEPAASDDRPDSISWTASEFVAHEKSANWYLALVLVAALIGGVIYLITKDFISVGVVVMAALLLAVYGARKPRQLEYKLSPQGIKIGDKHYLYSEFRSFSVMPEGAFQSIVFMPLKRFSPPITIYFSPEDEQKIADLLVDKLPFEEMRRDAVDSLMRRIRF